MLWLLIGAVFVVSGYVEDVFLGLIEFLAMGRSAVCGKSLCVTHVRIVVRLGFAYKKSCSRFF